MKLKKIERLGASMVFMELPNFENFTLFSVKKVGFKKNKYDEGYTLEFRDEKGYILACFVEVESKTLENFKNDNPDFDFYVMG